MMNEADDEEDDSRKEYIFLIDRSGSMYRTIKLACEALKLFLYSLPTGSRFNVCSYGSVYEFMFEERSVEYNDENLEYAIEQISDFSSNFGGTMIYEPLNDIFSRSIPADCQQSHIYLLTDGAIWDTEKVVNLVGSKSSITQRVHTFGVGHGADEQLIKRVAFKGFGHFYFIYNEEELEERVVSAISKTRLNYKVLQNVSLQDVNGQNIEINQTGQAEPLLEGSFIDMSFLLQHG